MKKVITYGTFDLLHYGHIRLLERARELGDYLIVGVTTDDFDKVRGKINVQQPLMERVEAVRATGLADEIIIEEYEGQKIDDIQRLGIDIFTVGSDWDGYFDYLKDYCEVVYLDRTQGISSTEIRSESSEVRIGIVGETSVIEKVVKECNQVNGLKVVGICSENRNYKELLSNIVFTSDYNHLLDQIDAVYILSHPKLHFDQAKEALGKGKNVICESPLALSKNECEHLFKLAKEKNCVLFEGIKTAYSTAYSRLLLQIKSGRIGDVVSIETTCTSLKNLDISDKESLAKTWNSICSWGPTAVLPILQLLGTDYKDLRIITKLLDENLKFDGFTKFDFEYNHAVATARVAKGIKSEGDLVISGTKGYAYVPAPWWKTDYFELRYENQDHNKRFFYQLDGEGIRYELVAFVKAIQFHQNLTFINEDISIKIAEIIEQFENGQIHKI